MGKRKRGAKSPDPSQPDNLRQADGMPKRRMYRQRAHANVFSDHNLEYPASPADMDWSALFPAHFDKPAPPSDDPLSIAPLGSPSRTGKRVEVLDVGCGFGGLIMAIAPLFPDTLILGLEIREQVCQFVTDKIAALRKQHEATSEFNNTSVLRINAMKFLPNLLEKAQLSHIFFLFADPCFKAKKHKARIISPTLLAEYAYLLRPGGILYTITDVPDLYEWQVKHLDAFPLFERIADAELASDPIVEQVRTSTEEGQKVARNDGPKLLAVYRRLPDP